MSSLALIDLGKQALMLMLLVSAIPVGASLVVGLLSSFLQAATQLQEPTLTTVPKVCAALGALALAGPWIAAALTRFTAQLLLALPQVGQS